MRACRHTFNVLARTMFQNNKIKSQAKYLSLRYCLIQVNISIHMLLVLVPMKTRWAKKISWSFILLVVVFQNTMWQLDIG